MSSKVLTMNYLMKPLRMTNTLLRYKRLKDLSKTKFETTKESKKKRLYHMLKLVWNSTNSWIHYLSLQWIVYYMCIKNYKKTFFLTDMFEKRLSLPLGDNCTHLSKNVPFLMLTFIYKTVSCNKLCDFDF